MASPAGIGTAFQLETNMDQSANLFARLRYNAQGNAKRFALAGPYLPADSVRLPAVPAGMQRSRCSGP